MSYITVPGFTNSAQFYSFSYDSASTLDPLLVKLQELENLPMGWRFGEGIPPTPKAVAVARDIYNMTAALRVKADAFPGIDGSLALVFYSGETCVELCIAPTGPVDLSAEEGMGFNFQETKDISNAFIGDIIKELVFVTEQGPERQVDEQRRDTWNFSGSSTHGTSIKMLDAFGVLVLPDQKTGPASHLLTFSAPSSTPQLQESAST